MTNINNILSTDGGYEVAWDYCLENNIFLPGDVYHEKSNYISHVSISGVVQRGTYHHAVSYSGARPSPRTVAHYAHVGDFLFSYSMYRTYMRSSSSDGVGFISSEYCESLRQLFETTLYANILSSMNYNANYP